MTVLFDRRWRVTVGELQTTNVDVEFKIVRGLRPRPGTCEVKLYNLTESHRNQMTALRRALVRVEAGYADAMPLLFQGDSRRVRIQREKTDWVTTVTAGDGDYAIRATRGARAFGPDTRLSEVIQWIAAAMGIGPGNTVDQLTPLETDPTPRLGVLFPRGTLVRTHATRELTDLLRRAGMEWSIQNGVLQILPRGGALGSATTNATLLDAGAGLVDSPERGQHGVVKAKSLLNADLVPGRLVQLQSAVLRGLYRATKITYTGNTRSNDWYAELELRQADS